MGRTGLERVDNEFSFGRRLQRIEALYAAVLGVPLASSLPAYSVAKLA
jgi:hypothetical protein